MKLCNDSGPTVHVVSLLLTLVLQGKGAELVEFNLALLAWNTLGRPHDHLYGLQGQGQGY